jgi:molybdate transport system substrate-binding protein
MRAYGARRTALMCAVAVLAAVTVYAGEIRVMTSGAFTAPYLELAPQFEQTMKVKVVTATTSMGTGMESIPSRVQRGEPVDVLILPEATLDGLIRAGKVVAGSKVGLARSAIGVAVRTGAVRPDISTVEALQRTLLQAKSIAYSASVSGDYLVNELFPRLGIAEQMKSKSRRIERERVGSVVARGEAEIGFQQISELLPVPGIDYIGPLPADVQRITTISAGVVIGSPNQAVALALVRYLASPAATSAIMKSGLEPIAVVQDAADKRLCEKFDLIVAVAARTTPKGQSCKSEFRIVSSVVVLQTDLDINQQLAVLCPHGRGFDCRAQHSKIDARRF